MNQARFTLEHPVFVERTGRGVRVAVVDSGIAPGHPHVGDIGDGVSLVVDVPDTLDRVGHGTAVAAAIRDKAPDVVLIPVKIFHRALTTDARALVSAIRWATDHGCHIVNLSLGTSNMGHEAMLTDAVAYAARHGTRVVSAFESDDIRWLPGSLPGAVGVVGDAVVDRDELLGAPDTPFADSPVVASIYPRPIPGVPRERNLSGISFAVANASGFLARMVETPAEL